MLVPPLGGYLIFYSTRGGVFKEDMMSLSAAEQYMLELINRARLDPVAEARRYDLALNTGLVSGTITGDAKQVLAPNTLLEQSALTHAEWMLAEDNFSHTGENGSSPGERIVDAGYVFTGQWTWRENLAWTGTTGTLDSRAAIVTHHEGLYRSEGHRENTFADAIKEIGVAQVQGDFNLGGTVYDSSMMALNFASSGRDVFITGVAYADDDADAFYSMGEGQAGIWVAADGQRVITQDAGGYGIAVAASDDLRVQVGQGDVTLATLRVDAAEGNVKLDVVSDADGVQTLLLSGDATLVSGIPNAELLGIADLNLTGNDDDNVLTGNAGQNVLTGAGGNDVLSGGGRRGDTIGGTATTNADVLLGGAGDDDLIGQAGADRLDGGTGDDMLLGGGGRDTFVFTGGNDVIADFTDNVDLVEIETDATLAEVIAMGDIRGGNAVFDFGGDTSLTLTGVTDLGALENDLLIV